MPYIANPDATQVAQITRAIMAYALRPTGLDVEVDYIRIPRARLYEDIAPTMIGLRREDFNVVIRQIAEETDALEEAIGTRKRNDVVLSRMDQLVDDWEPLLYDDFPESEPEPEDVAKLLTDHGIDVTTPIPDGLLIFAKEREPVAHDPAALRTCGPADLRTCGPADLRTCGPASSVRRPRSPRRASTGAARTPGSATTSVSTPGVWTA